MPALHRLPTDVAASNGVCLTLIRHQPHHSIPYHLTLAPLPPNAISMASPPSIASPTKLGSLGSLGADSPSPSDASKVPPSRFQKRKGSIYAVPSSRDGHVDSNYNTKFHEKHQELWKEGVANSGSGRKKSDAGIASNHS